MSESDNLLDECWREAAQTRMPKLTNREVAAALMRDPDGYAYVMGHERSVHLLGGTDRPLAHVTRIEALESGGVVIHSGDEGD
jgi:hypothetical protein